MSTNPNKSMRSGTVTDHPTKPSAPAPRSSAFVTKPIKLSQALENSIKADSTKLMLNFKNIEIIDAVPTQFRKCTSLMLSQNRISSLRGLLQFDCLRNLSLSYNYITDMEELQYIKPDHLESLSLEGNPIQQHPNYRHKVLSLFPHLKSLDSKVVKKNERVDIADGQALSSVYVTTMLALTNIYEQLSREVSRLNIKLELFRRAYGTHAAFFRCDPPDQTEILHRYRSRQDCIVTPIQNIPEAEASITPGKITAFIKETFRDSVVDENIYPDDQFKAELAELKASEDRDRECNNSIDASMEAISLNEKLRQRRIKDLESEMGHKIMQEIATIYALQAPHKARFIQEESEFTVYTTDPLFMKSLYELLRQKAKTIEQLEKQRTQLLNVNLFALSLPGIRSKFAWSRTHLSDAWAKIPPEYSYVVPSLPASDFAEATDNKASTTPMCYVEERSRLVNHERVELLKDIFVQYNYWKDLKQDIADVEQFKYEVVALRERLATTETELQQIKAENSKMKEQISNTSVIESKLGLLKNENKHLKEMVKQLEAMLNIHSGTDTKKDLPQRSRKASPSHDTSDPASNRQPQHDVSSQKQQRTRRDHLNIVLENAIPPAPITVATDYSTKDNKAGPAPSEDKALQDVMQMLELNKAKIRELEEKYEKKKAQKELDKRQHRHHHHHHHHHHEKRSSREGKKDKERPKSATTRQDEQRNIKPEPQQQSQSLPNVSTHSSQEMQAVNERLSKLTDICVKLARTNTLRRIFKKWARIAKERHAASLEKARKHDEQRLKRKALQYWHRVAAQRKQLKRGMKKLRHVKRKFKLHLCFIKWRQLAQTNRQTRATTSKNQQYLAYHSDPPPVGYDGIGLASTIPIMNGLASVTTNHNAYSSSGVNNALLRASVASSIRASSHRDLAFTDDDSDLVNFSSPVKPLTQHRRHHTTSSSSNVRSRRPASAMSVGRKELKRSRRSIDRGAVTDTEMSTSSSSDDDDDDEEDFDDNLYHFLDPGILNDLRRNLRSKIGRGGVRATKIAPPPTSSSVSSSWQKDRLQQPKRSILTKTTKFSSPVVTSSISPPPHQHQYMAPTTSPATALRTRPASAALTGTTITKGGHLSAALSRAERHSLLAKKSALLTTIPTTASSTKKTMH